MRIRIAQLRGVRGIDSKGSRRDMDILGRLGRARYSNGFFSPSVYSRIGLIPGSGFSTTSL